MYRAARELCEPVTGAFGHDAHAEVAQGVLVEEIADEALHHVGQGGHPAAPHVLDGGSFGQVYDHLHDGLRAELRDSQASISQAAVGHTTKYLIRPRLMRALAAASSRRLRLAWLSPRSCS